MKFARVAGVAAVVALFGVWSQISVAAVPHWTDEYLPDPAMEPVIRRCLAVHPGKNPMVELIYHAYRGAVTVYTLDVAGVRHSCVVEIKGAKLMSHEVVFKTDGPLFVPARAGARPPKGDCLVVTPIKHGKRLQGWKVAQRPPLPDDQPDYCSAPVWTGLE
ncbi:MAG TPA: hypothetical protein VM469_11150 [Pseudoxanthomonas sp.]|nr:hypothetical protein [Pseudoxanthomonas sp.]